MANKFTVKNLNTGQEVILYSSLDYRKTTFAYDENYTVFRRDGDIWKGPFQ